MFNRYSEKNPQKWSQGKAMTTWKYEIFERFERSDVLRIHSYTKSTQNTNFENVHVFHHFFMFWHRFCISDLDQFWQFSIVPQVSLKQTPIRINIFPPEFHWDCFQYNPYWQKNTDLKNIVSKKSSGPLWSLTKPFFQIRNLWVFTLANIPT